MKIKEYIEFKRQYFPPRSRLIDLVAEGLLQAQSPTVSDEGMENDPDYTEPETDPNNPTDPFDPFA